MYSRADRVVSLLAVCTPIWINQWSASGVAGNLTNGFERDYDHHQDESQFPFPTDYEVSYLAPLGE